ncbi:MAG: hypothetical protein NTX50_29475 [Candidatus Sumerlaeota bacterium]|nr:hypothetical protein [Candidatus Sumerlaeota bacterium]
MQNLTEKIWRLKPPGGVFNDTVVVNLFPNLRPGARAALLHRAFEKGEILRLKPGLYCLADEFRTSSMHPFAVAGVLYAPSYVSLESALWHHSLIPEAIQQVACVIAERSRAYSNALGHFTYRRIPCRNLKAGVRAEAMDSGGWAFIAGPLRALADLIYLQKEISWKQHGLSFLTESLRIEPEDFVAFLRDNFDEVCDTFRSIRVRQYLEGLRRELKI